VEPGEHRYYGEQKFKALSHCALEHVGWGCFVEVNYLGRDLKK
jgi:hypothetical protein